MPNPLLIPGALIVAGVALFPLWEPDPTHCLLGILGLALLALSGPERPCRWLACWAAAFLLGCAAPGLQPQGPQLEGRVALRGALTQVRTHQALLDLHFMDQQPARGRVLLRLSEPPPKAGTQVAVFGSARPAWTSALPGEPDPEHALRLQGVRSALSVSQLIALGHQPEPAPDHFAPATHGGLLRALATGDRSRINPDSMDLLRRTGTAHLVAISGLHLGMLSAMAAGMVSLLLRPFTLLRPGGGLRWIPGVAGVLAVLAFGQLVGWPVSARRAACMVAGGMAGVASSRGVQPWNLLGLAAGVVALAEPSAVCSVGFGLSFGAVAGILSVTPRLERLLPPDLPSLVVWLSRALFATVGASMGTLATSAWIFQELPAFSPMSNLLAIPLVSVVVLPAALLTPTFGLLPLAVGDAGLELTLAWLTLTDGPLLHPAVGPLGAAGLAVAPLLARWPGAMSWVLLVSLGLRPTPALLQVTFLSVGQGDAALVELPDGPTLLIDGGPGDRAVLRWLRRRGLKRIDEVWLSHPHPDHMQGLQLVLEQLEVGGLRVSRPPLPSETSYQALWSTASTRGVPILTPSDPLPDDRMALLHPTPGFIEGLPRRASVNEHSLVLRVRQGAHSFWFTGDLEEHGEQALTELLQRYPMSPATVLKVAHHGSRSSSSLELLDELRPRYAVVSCGRESRFKHPHPQALARLRDSEVLRTDIDGTLQWRSDGQLLSRRSWRPGQGWSDWREAATDLRWRTRQAEASVAQVEEAR